MSPNAVTAIRAVLVAWIATLMFGPPPTRDVMWIALVVAATAAILDGVDGWLARRTGQSSAFGARFDMETDAALICVLSILAWRWGKAGAWVLGIGSMRYLFVAGGALMPWLRGRLTPTWRGKTVAVVQMVTLIVAIGPIVPVRISAAGTAGALILLIWSFAIDVGRLWRGRVTSSTSG